MLATFLFSIAVATSAKPAQNDQQNFKTVACRSAVDFFNFTERELLVEKPKQFRDFTYIMVASCNVGTTQKCPQKDDTYTDLPQKKWVE